MCQDKTLATLSSSIRAKWATWTTERTSSAMWSQQTQHSVFMCTRIHQQKLALLPVKDLVNSAWVWLCAGEQKNPGGRNGTIHKFPCYAKSFLILLRILNFVLKHKRTWHVKQRWVQAQICNWQNPTFPMTSRSFANWETTFSRRHLRLGAFSRAENCFCNWSICSLTATGCSHNQEWHKTHTRADQESGRSWKALI